MKISIERKTSCFLFFWIGQKKGELPQRDRHSRYRDLKVSYVFLILMPRDLVSRPVLRSVVNSPKCKFTDFLQEFHLFPAAAGPYISLRRQLLLTPTALLFAPAELAGTEQRLRLFNIMRYYMRNTWIEAGCLVF